MRVRKAPDSDARAIFIAGPTASGKSALALRLACEINGEIVNADAMQVYRDLRIVTARPTVEDEAAAPHHLYGVLNSTERCSAGRWVRMAAATIADIHARQKVAIITGGTGLYFKALEEGLSPIPETPPDIRTRALARHSELGAAAFHDEVIAADPAMAHLPAGDTQRLVRAWEVFQANGRPLSYYQQLPREPLINPPRSRVVIAPPREVLYQRCDARAEEMLNTGAVEEVRALLALSLSPALPVMKALGVPEIAAFLHSECAREETLAALQQNTRRFAKRQMTWFRHQTEAWSHYESSGQAIMTLQSI